jgi:mRNA interferase RelE/StbE
MQGDIKKLQGHDHDWRLRVGDYRVRFAVDTHTDQIIVLRILPRGRAYRD